MPVIKLIGCMLNLRRILKIKRFSFQKWGKELHLWVKPYRNGCLCPKCRRRGIIKRTMPQQRVWRDVRICGKDVFFHYTPREIICPTHGRCQEIIPWADTFSQVKYRFEALALRYSQSVAQKDAASFLNIHAQVIILKGDSCRLKKRIKSGWFPYAIVVFLPETGNLFPVKTRNIKTVLTLRKIIDQY